MVFLPLMCCVGGETSSDFGVEKSVDVEGMSKEEIATQVELLAELGNTLPRYGSIGRA